MLCSYILIFLLLFSPYLYLNLLFHLRYSNIVLGFSFQLLALICNNYFHFLSVYIYNALLYFYILICFLQFCCVFVSYIKLLFLFSTYAILLYTRANLLFFFLISFAL